jgi:hypothetical protein
MNFEEKINSLVCPEHWIAEGSEHPNYFAKRNAILVCNKILQKYKLLPVVIAPTIVNGVYLKYIKDDKELIIETDNDGGIVVCIVQDKTTLYCAEIKELDFKYSFKIFNNKKIEK